MHLKPRSKRLARPVVGPLFAAGPVAAAVAAAAASLFVPAQPAYAQRVFGLDTSSAANTNAPTQTQWNNAFNDVDGDGVAYKFAFVRSSRGGLVSGEPATGQPAGQGRLDDAHFYDNITRATNAGMLAGSYHFARADLAPTAMFPTRTNTGADDANHYLERAGMYMRPGYLLPVFDLEDGNSENTTAELTAWSMEWMNTIYNAKGFYPIVYTNSSYNNDEVGAQLAWNNFGSNPKSDPRTFQWLARPGGNLATGEPVPSTSAPGYPNPYGVWDPKFVTRTNSRDPAVNPWAFWQNGSGSPNGPGFLIDFNAANGNIEFVKDFLVPALWTNSGSSTWGTISNWNSDNPGHIAGNLATGPAARLPNSLDWVKLQNPGGGTVTVNAAVSIRKFYTQQPVNITTGTFTVGYIPGSGGKWDVPSEFAAPVTLTGGGYTAHTTQVNSDGGQFNVNGGTVTFRNINLAADSSTPGKLVIGGNATYVSQGGGTAGTAVIRSTGTGALAGFVDLGAASRTLTLNNGPAAVDLSIQAPVAGTGGLVKAGTGTLQLEGTNTYSGGTTVSAGALRITRDANLGATPGSPQAANIVLNGGTLQTGAEITGISLTNAGSGYTSFPTLTINGGGADVVPASANVLAGITSIDVTAGGSNYINQGAAPAANAAGTFVDIVGGGGTGATAFATVVGGAVTGITIITPGTGYTSMPSIHISSTLNAGFAAGSGAVAQVDGIAIQGVALNDGGFDYAAPTLTLTGGGGAGASATATSNPNLSLATNRGVQLGSPGGTLHQAAGSTLTIGGPISGLGQLVKTGTGTLVLTGANSYASGTLISAGTVIGSAASLPGNITNNAALVFNQAVNGTFAGTIGGTGTLAKTGAGTLTLSSANTYSGATSVTGGKLVAANANALGTGALTVNNAAVEAQAGLPKALTVAGIMAVGTGHLNLTNNDLVVKASSLTAVRSLITQGYNNGTWNGPGINSSSAAGDPNADTALGYADNAELGLTSFSGVTLTGPEILVKYTYYGDADLTGIVDTDDFQLFLAGYQDSTLPRTWVYGDFDYSGAIDTDDFQVFLYGYQNQGGPLSELAEAVADADDISSADRAFMQAAIAAVPEPASLGVLGLAVVGLAGRRRKNARA